MTGQTLRVGRDLSPAERRTAILRSSVDCVAEIGHDNIRLRDVANSAGVSVGLLQHYFETREDLISETFRQASEDVLSDWRELLDTDAQPWDRIVGLVTRLALREKLRTYCMLWLDFATASSRSPDIRLKFRAIYDAWYSAVHEAIVEGTAAGTFAPVAPVPDVVEILLNHIDGCELNIASHTDAMSGARLYELTLRLASLLLRYEPEPTRPW